MLYRKCVTILSESLCLWKNKDTKEPWHLQTKFYKLIKSNWIFYHWILEYFLATFLHSVRFYILIAAQQQNGWENNTKVNQRCRELLHSDKPATDISSGSRDGYCGRVMNFTVNGRFYKIFLTTPGNTYSWPLMFLIIWNRGQEFVLWQNWSPRLCL